MQPNRTQWDLPYDIVAKILKAAEPHIRLRLQVELQTLRDRAHCLRLYEDELTRGDLIRRAEVMKQIDRQSEFIYEERRRLLDMLCIIHKGAGGH